MFDVLLGSHGAFRGALNACGGVGVAAFQAVILWRGLLRVCRRIALNMAVKPEDRCDAEARP
jgi:hypothetical protein